MNNNSNTARKNIKIVAIINLILRERYKLFSGFFGNILLQLDIISLSCPTPTAINVATTFQSNAIYTLMRII